MAVDISLEGYDQLLKDLTMLANVLDDKEMENKLVERARGLRNKIRKAAPKGPTGNLREGVEAKRFRRKIRGNPGAFVRMNRKKAPHYHLVEFGTEGIRLPKGKVLHFKVESGAQFGGGSNEWLTGQQDIFVRSVGPMPAKPFFRSTVDNEQENVQQGIVQDIDQIVERAAAKTGAIRTR